MSFDFVDQPEHHCICGVEIDLQRYRTHGRCDECLFAAFAKADWEAAFLRKLKGWSKQDET